MTASFWQRQLIFLAVGIISVLIAEHAVRFTQPELNPNSHIKFVPATDTLPALGLPNSTFRQIKNTGDFNVIIRFNALGLRDDQSVAKAQPKDFILVGDSYTFGWGVQEKQRISEQLEAVIKRRVFNISIPTGFNGYDDLLTYAKQHGAQTNRVIIAVSMETDLHLYSDSDLKKNVQAAVEHKPQRSWLMPIKGYLAQRSALYGLATSLVHRIPLLKELATKTGMLIPNLEGIRKYEFSQAVIEASAQRLKRLADQYKTTVLIIPSRALWHSAFQKIEANRHASFVKRLDELNLNVLDLRPVFEKTNNPLSLHFKNDPHWKPAGHKIAAQALEKYLRQQYDDL